MPLRVGRAAGKFPTLLLYINLSIGKLEEKMNGKTMKEIDQETYEELRGKGNVLIGRVHFHANPQKNKIIYFQIDEGQKNFSCTEILDTLSLSNLNLQGRVDVIRHWTSPEVKMIDYRLP